MSSVIPCLKAKVYCAVDFTTFVERTQAVDIPDSVSKEIEDLESYEDMLKLVDGDHKATGRSLVCSCFGGKYLSVTLRTGKPERGNKITSSKKELATEYVNQHNVPTNEYPFPLTWISDAIYELLWNMRPEARWTGAILITGGTGSGKSQVACALIYRYLKWLRTNGSARRPHFLTIEKPIEKWLSKDPSAAQEWGIDYTPRLIDKDVRTIRDGLEDALRQTPAVVYLGELRRDSELRDFLWFAGTGHLVIATAHAGSLVEAMDTLFRQSEADTAARRQQVGQVLSSVIHLRTLARGATAQQSGMIALPAMWKLTVAGLDALVADGLASLLPHNPPEDDAASSSYGRLFFANRLLMRLNNSDKSWIKKHAPTIERELRDQALRWDLEGM